MTILDTLPPMRPRGAFALSRAPFDDPGLYGRLLAAARHPAAAPCCSPATPWPRWGRAGTRGRRWRTWSGATPPTCSRGDTRVAACTTRTAWRRSARPSRACAPARPADALLPPDEVVAAAVDEAELVGEHLLALVPVSRPADVPAALGWAGSRRRGTAGTTSPRCRRCCVAGRTGSARCWCGWGARRLELAVAAPPWERSECLAIAAEHYAFCDDTYTGNPGTLRDYANLLRGACRWSFWWG